MLSEQETEIHVCFRIFWIACNRLPVERCGVGIHSFPAVKDTEIVLRVGVLRIACDRFLECGLRFGPSAALHCQDAELVVGDCEIRIQLDGLFELVALGGLIAEFIEREREIVVQLRIFRIGAQGLAIGAGCGAGISGGQKLVCLCVELTSFGMRIAARC